MRLIYLALTLSAACNAADEPNQLTKLRGSYDAAIQKATTPIQKTYISALEKLKTDFTKSGNLEAAIAVNGELQKLKQPAIDVELPSGFTMKALAGEYTFESNKEYKDTRVLSENGTMTKNGGNPVSDKWGLERKSLFIGNIVLDSDASRTKFASKPSSDGTVFTLTRSTKAPN
jgi:hypothetical protein